MKVQVEMLKGKIVKNRDRLREVFTSLDDGIYIVDVERNNPLLMSRDYQKAYFEKIDECSMHTGHEKYELHELFKKHIKIESTKEMDVAAWKSVLTALTWWAYTSFDCMV